MVLSLPLWDGLVRRAWKADIVAAMAKARK